MEEAANGPTHRPTKFYSVFSRIYFWLLYLRQVPFASLFRVKYATQHSATQLTAAHDGRFGMIVPKEADRLAYLIWQAVASVGKLVTCILSRVSCHPTDASTPFANLRPKHLPNSPCMVVAPTRTLWLAVSYFCLPYTLSCSCRGILLYLCNK